MFIGALLSIASVINVQAARNADKTTNNFMTEDTRQLVRGQAYQAMKVAMAMQQQQQLAKQIQASVKSKKANAKSSETKSEVTLGKGKKGQI